MIITKAEIVDDARVSVSHEDIPPMPSPSRPHSPETSRPPTSLSLGRQTPYDDRNDSPDIQEPIMAAEALAEFSARVDKQYGPRRSSRKTLRSNSVSIHAQTRSPSHSPGPSVSERVERAGNVKIRPSLAPSFVSQQDGGDTTVFSFIDLPPDVKNRKSKTHERKQTGWRTCSGDSWERDR
jgi:hypothetical protein